MHILGIAAFHRDAAAALVVDGRPVAAAQESQFTRTPLDAAFPTRSIRSCLEHGGVRGRDLDHVVFYEKPLRKFERVLATQLQAFPRSTGSFVRSMFLWLGNRLWIKNRIARDIGIDPSRIRFTEHQLALAAAAYYPSPFDESAVLTIDDVGEWTTASIGVGRGATLELLREMHFPDSLGLFASAITQFLGFVPGEEEHKVEALAPFGTPEFIDAMRALAPTDDGYFHIEPSSFRFAFDSERLHDDSLIDHLGPPRYSGDPLACGGADTRHADIAASLQVVLQEHVLALAFKARELTSCASLCVAGQLASNRRIITQLAQDGPFEAVFVPGAADKSGGALGAALHVHHQVAGITRDPTGLAMDLGEAVDQADERAEPGATSVPDPGGELGRRLLAGERVAWVRGRIEFGDHSDGRRVVLARPDAPTAANGLLSAIQHTEPFLPCRLAITAEAAATAFAWPRGSALTRSNGSWQVPATAELRNAAPGALAPDGTVWPAVVDATTDPELHAVLLIVGAVTGTPALLLADFRPRGSTLVRTEADAVRAFRRSTLDALVVANRLYEPATA